MMPGVFFGRMSLGKSKQRYGQDHLLIAESRAGLVRCILGTEKFSSKIRLSALLKTVLGHFEKLQKALYCLCIILIELVLQNYTKNTSETVYLW